MGNCEKYALLSQNYLQMIEVILQREDNIIEKWIVLNCIKYEDDLKMGYISEPCMQCEHCLDFSLYRKHLYGYLLGEVTKENFIKAIQHCKKLIAIDKILSQSTTITRPSEFNRESFIYNENNIIIYLDKNVYNNYFLKDEDFKNKVLESKKNKYVHYVYSPSHLQELQRMDYIEHKQMLINAITMVTSNLFVSNFDSGLSLAYEDPKYGLKRIQNSRDLVEEYENYKLILSDDRKIFHPEYTSHKHTRELTPEKVFEHEMFKAACSEIENQEWINCSGRIENYNSLNGAINSLFKVLDNLSFKRNKSNRTIKSGAHDIEHVIYATISNMFVSDDKNLRERVILIYKALGINTLVISPKELLNTLNQLKGSIELGY